MGGRRPPSGEDGKCWYRGTYQCRTSGHPYRIRLHERECRRPYETDTRHCNNNLNTLGKMSIRELCQYNGIGEAKAITILAACELGKRRQAETPEERPDLGTATRIYNHMRPVMQDLDIEEFWALLLNQHYRLIKKVRISHGGITETAVDIRIIMKEAVLANCTILAVCHNHPSGNLCPSKADEILTRSLDRACEVMNIHFLDHVIVTDGEYYSFHEEGRC